MLNSLCRIDDMYYLQLNLQLNSDQFNWSNTGSQQWGLEITKNAAGSGKSSLSKAAVVAVP